MSRSGRTRGTSREGTNRADARNLSTRKYSAAPGTKPTASLTGQSKTINSNKLTTQSSGA